MSKSFSFSILGKSAAVEVCAVRGSWWQFQSTTFSTLLFGSCLSGLFAGHCDHVPILHPFCLAAKVLRAALQQSFQLLLDGFLVLLNEGLGADPIKGRAAALQAAKILRKIREQLWARAAARLTAAQQRIQQEEALGPVVDAAMKHLNQAVDLCGAARSRLESLLEIARLRLPEEDQQWLPTHPHASFLRDHLLVGAWLALLVYVGYRMIRLALNLVFRFFLVWPCRCSWVLCRRCFRCLCPCRRKAVKEQAVAGVVHANGSAMGDQKACSATLRCWQDVDI